MSDEIRQPTTPAGTSQDGGRETRYRGKTVGLPAEWTVEEYEQGTYGFGNVAGVDATFAAPDGSVRLSAYPVTFERQGGRETFSGVSLESSEPEQREARGDTPVAPVTAFALGAYYRVDGEHKHETVAILGDGYDPLVLACWIAQAVENGQDFERFQQRSRGIGAVSIHDYTRSSPREVLDAEAESDGESGEWQEVNIPFRYARYIDGWPEDDAGIPVIPPTAGYVSTVVSASEAAEVGIGPGDVAGFPVVRDGESSFDVGHPMTFVMELEVDDVYVGSLADSPQAIA